jgi:hypothetical protein
LGVHAVFAGFSIIATFSYFGMAGSKGGIIPVQNIHAHVIETTLIEFDPSIVKQDIIRVRQQSLHGHGTHKGSVSLSAPSIVATVSGNVIPFANHIDGNVKDLLIGFGY